MNRYWPVVFTVLILALPARAYASREPTPRERTELLTATSYTGQIPPRREWAVRKIWVSNLRISTINHAWATGKINEIFNGGDDGAELLYHFRDHAWHLRTLGTSGIFCGVPAAVAKDLGGSEDGCEVYSRTVRRECEAEGAEHGPAGEEACYDENAQERKEAARAREDARETLAEEQARNKQECAEDACAAAATNT
jgi:hypothetical protein